MFNKITIVGVGLIGGSIGLACKKRRLAKKVIGVCRRESSRRKALKFKAVDKATLNLEEAVTGADLVIIASPVGKIVELAAKCVKFMGKGAILTDVGSSKERIVREIEKIVLTKTNFAGSHPMAGSDKSGVECAKAGIFENNPVIITKTKKTDKKSLAILARFWKKLGARVFVLSPAKHDRDVALVSYLPHALSYTLAGLQTKDSVKLAGGSLRDMTRVSSSDPELWKDIFLSSRAPLLGSIRAFSRDLKKLEKSVRKGNAKEVIRFLTAAKKVRDSIYDGSSNRRPCR